MASNKRLLKKEIRSICGALAGECVIAQITIPGISSEALNKIIYELAELQENAIKRISVSFPQSPSGFEKANEYKKARAKYFNAAFASLKKEFNNHIDTIIKEMNSALPQEQKEANKKALNEK